MDVKAVVASASLAPMSSSDEKALRLCQAAKQASLLAQKVLGKPLEYQAFHNPISFFKIGGKGC